MISYLREQFLKFSRSDFSPKPELGKAAIIFLAWALPAVIAVTFTRWRAHFASVEYFDTAISEGIGPHLWNVVGTVGVVLFSLFILAPRAKWLAVAANNVFVNTYAIGALTFGLLFGQWVNAFASANLDRWQAWAYGAGFGFLFVLVIALNFSVWYLGYLTMPTRINTGFAVKLSTIDFRVRAVLGLLLGTVTVFFLMMER
ncbi:MAG: hypothetical protein ACXWT1_18155 [Methylobacter sp.]